MNFSGNGYYQFSRRLLLLVGLWPCEHSTFKYCRMILCNVTVLLTVASQIVHLIALRQNIDLVLKILAPTVPCIIYAIKYQTFCIIARKLKHLMEHVEKDWNMLKDKRELEIIERYTYVGNMCAVGFAIFAVTGIIIFVLTPFVPNVLDIFAPLNVSRPRQIPIPGEYFVDQQKYFYVILLHLDVTLIVIATTLLGTESLYVMHVQHACGLFQIVSYRMKRAFDKNLLQAYTPKKRTTIVYQRITEAVYFHKRALKFYELLWSSLVVSYSILLTIGITSLIINLFCLFQAILFMKEMFEVARLTAITFSHIFYLFLGNYVGQILIDHSINISEKTYLTQWHDAPLRAQRLLLLVMQRSMRSCKMTIGGMFVPSLEGFATLMSTTMSYFMVLWSARK